MNTCRETISLEQKTPQSEIALSETEALSPLEAAIHQALPDHFDEHEGFCLAIILQHSVCKFSEGIVLGPLSIEQIITLLRKVRSTANDRFTEDEPATESQEALEEWFTQLPKVLELDPVLSNHDRLTILRLTQKLLAAGEIQSIIPAEGTRVLLETVDGQKVEQDIK